MLHIVVFVCLQRVMDLIFYERVIWHGYDQIVVFVVWLVILASQLAALVLAYQLAHHECLMI